MKKILLAISVFTLALIGSVDGQTIRELKFPYEPGYTLNLSGEMTTVLQDGSKVKDSSFTYYYIDRAEDKDGLHWVNFQCNTSESSNMHLYESLLALNESGMLYQSNAKKGSKKKKLVQAISLPLTEGKIWYTNLEGMKAECKCISTHTFVKTPFGDIDCFCVQTISIIQKLKGFNYKMRVLEFYNQEIGKVAYNAYYYYEKENGDAINVMEVKEVLADYGFKKK
ncbi:MAG: hypothetical protein WCI97_03655 [Bacteroidota bacterium]